MALVNAANSRMEFWLETKISLTEVRSLAELTAKIELQGHSFAFVEITATNLEAALSWLASSSRNGNGFRAVAVVDYGLNSPAIAAALREAGAIDIADSPRRLQNAIQIGLLHTASTKQTDISSRRDGQSLEDWSRSLLPWQVAP
jgi:hypothetical protein